MHYYNIFVNFVQSTQISILPNRTIAHLFRAKRKWAVSMLLCKHWNRVVIFYYLALIRQFFFKDFIIIYLINGRCCY